MPSTRKRIGYLPKINIQKIITNIAIKENLSQSKVVGILVEEALMARGFIEVKNKNILNRNNLYTNENNLNTSYYKFSDLDELISDKGITYNKIEYKHNTGNLSYKTGEAYNEELFEQFKQFIQFQKMKEEEEEEET